MTSPSTLHKCLDIIEQFLHPFPNIRGTPLPPPAIDLLIDGSAFKDSSKQAGYAIVSLQSVIESGPLPPGTTSQQAELIALTRALTLAIHKSTNIYIDSRYAFHIIHSYIPI